MNQNLNNQVVLLEGTRKVPSERQQDLVDLTTGLADKYPQAIFRSGNAAGSDELFAKGIESVDATRMQQVLPYLKANKKRLHPNSPVMSLADLNLDELQQLAQLGIKATPGYESLFKLYLKRPKENTRHH